MTGPGEATLMLLSHNTIHQVITVHSCNINIGELQYCMHSNRQNIEEQAISECLKQY